MARSPGAPSHIVRTLGRVSLLLMLALAAWGALLFASALANAVGEGPGAAFGRLVPPRGGSVWGWLGAFSVLLAITAAVAGAALLVWNRLALTRAAEGEDGP
jgi:hypothetical protein